MAGYDCDVAVIGAGPGGYVAAIRAAQLGLKTVVIEKDKPGGVCLNIGCIPSKALIHQAGFVRDIPELEKLGMRVDRSGFDYRAAFAASRAAADTLSQGVTYLLKKNNIELIKGAAALAAPDTIAIGDRRLVSRHIIIATGSRPRALPGFPFDEKTIVSSTGALMLEALPKTAVIIGSGAIGIEFAHIWNAFGVDVHVVEILDRILPLEDDEAVDVLRKALTKRGVTFHTGTKAGALNRKGSGAEVTLESPDRKKKTISADLVLVAVGRTPNSEDLGLEKIGVETDHGFIVAGDYYQTNVPGVYAIGDVIGAPLLAHAASAEGEIAAEHCAGREPAVRVDGLRVPSAVYSEPQIGSFGLTERRAKELKLAYKKSVFPYRGAGKSVAIGRSEGLVKLLTAPDTNEIIGAHIAGAEATELIHEVLLAASAELLPEDIAQVVHAHPTLSEAIGEAARSVFGKPVNV